MRLSRGNPHLPDQEASPTVAVPAVDTRRSDDEDEATPLSWWVKTIASWTLLTAAVGLLALLVVIPRLTGSTAYTVLTGSMEPDYPPGTLIVVKPTPGDQLTAGDVITFQPVSGNPAVITHRIVSTFYDSAGNRRFITKGDANKVQDDTQLVEGQIRGKLIYSVPYAGRINSVLSGSTRSVVVFVIAGGLGAYALWMWISGVRERSRNKSNDDAPSARDDAPERPVDTSTGEHDLPLSGVAADTGATEMVCRACGCGWDPVPRPRPPLAYSRCPDPPSAYSCTTRPLPITND